MKSKSRYALFWVLGVAATGLLAARYGGSLVARLSHFDPAVVQLDYHETTAHSQSRETVNILFHNACRGDFSARLDIDIDSTRILRKVVFAPSTGAANKYRLSLAKGRHRIAVSARPIPFGPTYSLVDTFAVKESLYVDVFLCRAPGGVHTPEGLHIVYFCGHPFWRRDCPDARL